MRSNLLFSNLFKFCAVLFLLALLSGYAIAEQPLRRTILAVWDSSSGSDLQKVTIRMFLETPLNYIGFRVRYIDVSEVETKGFTFTDDVEGVVAYFPSGSCARTADPVFDLVGHAATDGRRVLILGNPPFRTPCPGATPAVPQVSRILDTLGVSLTETDVVPLPDWVYESDPKTTGVAALVPEPFWAQLPVLNLRSSEARTVVTARSGDGAAGLKVPLAVINRQAALVLGEIAFGRYAGSGAAFERRTWFMDPFVFLAAVFGGDKRPAPDSSVGFGRRLLIVNADLSQQESSSSQGSAASKTYESIKAFAAQYPLELFSVTRGASRGLDAGPPDIHGEVSNVVFANCSECSMVNPGDSRFDRLRPSAAWLEPLLPIWEGGDEVTSRPVVFPFADEVTYVARTPLAPFAFTGVLESHRNTGEPRILRPLAIRFGADILHMEARRLAVSKVLTAVQGEPHCAVSISDWTESVIAGARVSISPCGPACWSLSDSRGLFSLRLPESSGVSIDWGRSSGVLGVRKLAGELYVALERGRDTHTVAMSAAAVSQPELEESSVPVSVEKRSHDTVWFSVQPTVGGFMVWRVPWKGCSLLSVGAQASRTFLPTLDSGGHRVAISIPRGVEIQKAVLRPTECSA